tara:strand:- start:77 stop:631 length:555 start_codon:yes stop_codon:yes gene_type:complete
MFKKGDLKTVFIMLFVAIAIAFIVLGLQNGWFGKIGDFLFGVQTDLADRSCKSRSGDMVDPDDFPEFCDSCLGLKRNDPDYDDNRNSDGDLTPDGCDIMIDRPSKVATCGYYLESDEGDEKAGLNYGYQVKQNGALMERCCTKALGRLKPAAIKALYPGIICEKIKDPSWKLEFNKYKGEKGIS